MEIFVIIAIVFIQFIDDGHIQNNDNENQRQTKNIVTHIVDGDTFDIASGERVRMIGIDTPERGKHFYKEASVRLAELIDGKEVTLTKDISETDRYGRLLRHVYYDDVWINKQMIEEGYAKFVTFPPDVAHVEIFKQAQREARNNELGVWTKLGNYE